RRLDHLLPLAGLIEIGHDIATAHQFPIDIKLGKRRPVGIHLQVLAHIGMLKNIHEGEFFTASHQRLYSARGKSALRHLRRTLHIKNDLVAFNLVFDCFHYVHSDTSRTLNGYQTGCGLLAKRSQILHRIAIAYHAARETPTPSLPRQIPLSPRLALPYLHAWRKGITVINPVISVPRSI